MVLRYGYGMKCGGEGDGVRRTAVRLVCGEALRVMSAYEDGNCRYSITVSTPVACFKRARSNLSSKLQSLKQQLSQLE